LVLLSASRHLCGGRLLLLLLLMLLLLCLALLVSC
jgi:hypothetical protein